MRMMLIFFFSGLGGYAIAGIFAPKQVAVGADPAIYGLLGVLLVELFQSWQIVPEPGKEFAKIGGITAFLLLLGTLPFLDNFSHIGGLCFGLVPQGGRDL